MCTVPVSLFLQGFRNLSLGPNSLRSLYGIISFSEVKDVTAVLYADDVTFIENFDSRLCCNKTLLSFNYIE